ncbi:hypothetical protein P280DRAFT_392920 [Massarina eburnea CBS 473.64]|uniref:Fe2OG dioxygenase domain-containing protein n=1 Tax=Massarina eburnea CBS 473.64 TaxID=1395130 RepID=A0A6A6SDI7_9PLEO|nr:hypothetical protein P280DRAFT_392920 [Massarina eburnea CBS 473.64]
MALLITKIISAPLPQLTRVVEQPAAQTPVQHVTRFDPKKHLAGNVMPKVLGMTDLGYPADTGVSPVAVSEAFQLFTPEAIQIMREEISQPAVHGQCSFSSNLAACQLRGYAKQYAPFAYEAWKHPETVAIISRIAAMALVPVMDYEIGHINLSIKTEAETTGELAAFNKGRRVYAKEEGSGGCLGEEKPIVDWHTDSYPFVCVLMMSDCTNMVGGETALRKADGEILKVRGPAQGCAVVLQGRYIPHQALRALGAQERITSVTSFRPKSAFVKDDSVLRTVRPISDLSALYSGFAEYRLEMLEERIRHERQQLASRRRLGERFNTLEHKEFLDEAIAFSEQTNGELVEDDRVTKGVIE